MYQGLIHQGHSALTSGKTRSISPENFTGEKGGGARATEGTGKHCARELGVGWKISPSISHCPRGNLPSGLYRRPWHDSTYLDDRNRRKPEPNTAYVLGRCNCPFRRSASG